MTNTVLVVDGGGRGAALVDKYAQSEHVGRVIAVPGNDLMQINTAKPVQTYPHLKTTRVREILAICEAEGVALVDVAQDRAVEVGLVDALIDRSIAAVGPTRAAGQIEWDKAWAREFGRRQGIPQPCFRVFRTQQESLDYVESQPDKPWFVKASGLAEGKGALPAKNRREARERIREIALFEDAGSTFLIEEWPSGDDGLAGEEFSTYVLSDGRSFVHVASAQDHKRANDSDEDHYRGQTKGLRGDIGHQRRRKQPALPDRHRLARRAATEGTDSCTIMG